MCDQYGVTKLCVFKMVCDKVVCLRWCVKVGNGGGGGGGGGGGDGIQNQKPEPHTKIWEKNKI